MIDYEILNGYVSDALTYGLALGALVGAVLAFIKKVS